MEVVKLIKKNYNKFLEVYFYLILNIESEKIVNEKYWDDMIKEADKNGDGEVINILIILD